MKRSTKIALVISLVLILAGTALFIGAAASMGFDLVKASMTPMTTNTYAITEDFTAIRVNGGECSVILLPSEDGTCKVELTESTKIYHKVAVKDSTLIINRIDEQKWYDHLGIYFYPFEVKLYLPEKDLISLHINVGSGNISVPANFSFQDIRLSTSSGNIDASCSVQNTAYVRNISGNIDLKGICCKELTAQVISGNLFLSNCTGETVSLKTTSGNIGFYDSDGKDITMETVSGDITGNLLTPKSFSATTVSGDINVPAGSTGDPCTVTTVSGNIRFEIN